MSEKESYVLTYDLLNIAACIAVVALHVNTIFWTFSTEPYWQSCLVTETVFYWAVPIFFMLSGATLMDYRDRYDTRTFLTKRFKKTVVPFLFWSVVSVFWALNVKHYIDAASVSTWQGWVNTIVNHQAMSIYWFFPPLFALYLCIPVLSSIPKEKRKHIFLYMILYAFISYSMIPCITPLFGVYITDALRSPLNGGGFVMFLLLGYCITRYPMKKSTRIIVYILGFFGWAIRFVYTREKSLALGYINQTFFGYFNFPGVLLAVAVFTWFWYHDWSFLNKPKIIKVIRELSSASFGIYLIHFYFMCFVIDTFAVDITTLQWRVAGVPLVYFSSLIIVLIGKCIPLVKKAFP